jgi:MtN3 and saliva related transmembrane protein
MSYIDIIGYVGNGIISCNMIPQVCKSYRTKSTEDISYLFIFTGITGLSLIAIYGYMIEAYPILAGSSFSILWYLILLLIKTYYSRKIQIIPMCNVL